MAQRFELPFEDDADEGAPDRIAHGVDYMLVPGGGLMFYYNYLDYTWVVASRETTARAYLDEVGEVSLLTLTAAELSGGDYTPIVRYLQRRFRVIKTLCADGDQVAYER